jgi:hypothetical protein
MRPERSTRLQASALGAGQRARQYGPTDQQIKAELTDLSALDIRNSRLRDAEGFRGFDLGHAAPLEPMLEPMQQRRANLELRRLRSGDASGNF